MSFSRQAYLAVALVVCAYLIFSIIKAKGKERKRLVIYFSSCCVLGIATLVILILTGLLNLDLLKTGNLSTLLDGRLSLWEKSIDSFKQFPFVEKSGRFGDFFTDSRPYYFVYVYRSFF